MFRPFWAGFPYEIHYLLGWLRVAINCLACVFFLNRWVRKKNLNKQTEIPFDGSWIPQLRWILKSDHQKKNTAFAKESSMNHAETTTNYSL